MKDGKGLAGLIPPINRSEMISQNIKTIPCIIRYGLDSAIVVNEITYDEIMPPIPSLNEVQIANILNYIIHEFKYKLDYFSEKDVEISLEKCDNK